VAVCGVEEFNEDIEALERVDDVLVCGVIYGFEDNDVVIGYAVEVLEDAEPVSEVALAGSKVTAEELESGEDDAGDQGDSNRGQALINEVSLEVLDGFAVIA